MNQLPAICGDGLPAIPENELPAIPNPILDVNARIIDKIEEFGKLKYSKERIAAALGYSKREREEFIRIFEECTSEERLAYERGLVIGDAEIEIGLSKAAQNGDNFCANELLNRQDHRRLDELRIELFGI